MMQKISEDRKPVIHSTIDTSRGYAVTSNDSMSSRSNEDRPFSMPSPISPLSASRSSSLPDPILTSETCGSPHELVDVSTPVSERGMYASAYGQTSTRTDASRPYRSSFSHYSQQEFSGLPVVSTHHHHHLADGYERQRNGEEDEKTLTKHEKRRRNHLNSEKRRRENIKGGMDALVDLVPTCRNIQESKANILRKTRDYINQLLHMNSDLSLRARVNETELHRLRQVCIYNGIDPNTGTMHSAPSVHELQNHRVQVSRLQ